MPGEALGERTRLFETMLCKFIRRYFCSLQVCSWRVKKVTESLSSPFLNAFLATPAGTFPVTDLPQLPSHILQGKRLNML